MPINVTGSLQYLSPQSTITGRYIAPDGELRLGQYEIRKVEIRNGRIDRSLSLENNGFKLVRHISRVSDFRNLPEVAALYPSEIERLVMALTGADRVVTFGYGYRSAAAYRNQLSPLRCQVTTEPATDVHVDYTPQRANQLALDFFRQAGVMPGSIRRFMALSVWRSFSSPPQNWPLTVCDARTVGPEEGIPDPTFPVATLPNRLSDLRTTPMTALPGGGMTFHFNPRHRWHYFPAMTRDEVVAFVQHDSARPRLWRTPHASFAAITGRGVPSRESVEVRSIAYFL